MDKRLEQIKKWKERPYSWSQHSSFTWDPEQWYEKYILGEDQGASREMEFGKFVGGKLEKDPTFLPQIPRHSVMEYEFKCMFGKIPVVGYADSFCDKTNKKLLEFKTGKTKNSWDQKKVDNHGQLTFYLLMNWLINKIKPEDVEVQLIWMPTQDNGDFSISFVEPIEQNIKSFKTKRTMRDILKFGQEINEIYKKMELFALAHN